MNPPRSYYYNSDTLIPVPFAILSSLIRIAHKYAVQDVLDDALSRLKKFHSNDLAAWQDADSRAQYVTTVPEDALTAIHLARLTTTPSLLPTAFLVCTQLAESCVRQPDGSHLSKIAALSVPEQVQIIVAKGLLVQALATRAFRLLAVVPSAQCATRAACEAVRAAPLASLVRPSCLLKPLLSDTYALTPMTDTFFAHCDFYRGHRSSFCRSCQEALVKEDETAMRLVWSHLPVLFELEREVDSGSWPGGVGCADVGGSADQLL